jgi:NAD(P)-dependent dehydrogenase (short-subunit alcohol dehydrogenase family)
MSPAAEPAVTGRLKDRVAIITGAAQGIGLACAERFRAEGARLMLSDVNEVAGATAAARLGAPFLRADAGIKAEVDALVARAVEVHGRVDIMLANAGILHAAEFLDFAEADFDRVIRTNLKSVFLCGQAAARQMVKQGGGGVIVSMSSINAVVAIPNQAAYAASKGGINQLTKVMAIALAPHGIRAVAIGPGTILTDMSRGAVLKDDAARRRILSRTPIGRFGEAAEVAAVAAFLASDDASYITGQTIYPDGGRLALNYTVPVPED